MLAPGWAAVRSWPLAQLLGRQPGWGGQRWVLSSFPPSIFPPLVFLRQERDGDSDFAYVSVSPRLFHPSSDSAGGPATPQQEGSIPSRCLLLWQGGGLGTSPSAGCH